MHSETASNVIFGWNPAWTATAIFAAAYVLIVSEKVNRAVVSLLGAGLMILAGVLSQEAAVRGIDFNTIGLLLGMMVIVGITRKSGVFQFVAIWSAKKVNAHPVGVLIMYSLVTAVLSALLDNVTTVLLVAPVTLLVTEELKLPAYPYLVSEILFSNIGGAATLIGDPPNIMIGSAAGLGFNDFVIHLAPVAVVVLVATLLPVYLLWRKDLVAATEARERVMSFQEHEAVRDAKLMKQSLAILTAVLMGFVMAHPLHLEPATIALFGAALLLLVTKAGEHEIQEAFGEAEWVTLMFFVGLFVLVQGLESTGVIRTLAGKLLDATGGNPGMTVPAILWGSAILSAFVDNIPFVATMIPLVKSMAGAYGGEQALQPLWWSLALGACLGGNGTLIGASANLMVAGMAERAGQPIHFLAFFKSCFLLMLWSIAICHVYLMIRYV